jgi:hypothetical protein
MGTCGRDRFFPKTIEWTTVNAKVSASFGFVLDL